MADKVEFNIFQIQTGQQSCFLLPQHLTVPLSKTARAVDISYPLLWKEPLKNKLYFAFHLECSLKMQRRACSKGVEDVPERHRGKIFLGRWQKNLLVALVHTVSCFPLPSDAGCRSSPWKYRALYFCSLPFFSRNSVWGLELQAIFSQGLLSWEGKIKLRLITFKWKWNQITQSFLGFHFYYCFNFSGLSVNSFPAFIIFKYSGFFFQFGMFSVGTLLNIIPNFFLMLLYTFYL